MITADSIIAAKPCPGWAPERVRAAITEPISAVALLRWDDIDPEDWLWGMFFVGGLPDRLLQLWAHDCAQRALNRYKDVDPGLAHAITVARRYVVGKATNEELTAIRNAAKDVAWNATWCAVKGAACPAARDAAWYAAMDAARSVAWYVVRGTVEDPPNFVWPTAWAAERQWQCRRLIELIEEEACS